MTARKFLSKSDGDAHHVQTKFLRRVWRANPARRLAFLDQRAILRELRHAISQRTNPLALHHLRCALRHGSSPGPRRAPRPAASHSRTRSLALRARRPTRFDRARSEIRTRLRTGREGRSRTPGGTGRDCFHLRRAHAEGHSMPAQSARHGPLLATHRDACHRPSGKARAYGKVEKGAGVNMKYRVVVQLELIALYLSE
jgi:hypothetical protein